MHCYSLALQYLEDLEAQFIIQQGDWSTVLNMRRMVTLESLHDIFILPSDHSGEGGGARGGIPEVATPSLPQITCKEAEMKS